MVKDINNYQFKRIRNIINYAYNNVPLYRNKYDAAGIKPQDIRTLSDFNTIPLLTKKELQEGFPNEMLSRKVNPASCYIVSTSGHTGSPVKLYRRKRELYALPIIYYLIYPLLPYFIKRISGIKTGHRITVILPQDESYDLYRTIKIFNKLPGFMTKSLQYISNETDVDSQLKDLNRHQPDFILSDLSVLKNIATYARNSSLELPSVKVLFVGSELIDGNSRRLLQNSFNANVIEHYGSEEAGTMAMECPQGKKLHIVWRANYIEILKNGEKVPAGTPGQVIVTTLLNTATPIIRYSGMDDIATMSPNPCSCGSKWPLLKMIDGRIVDSILLPNGNIVHPFNLTIAIENINGIRQYQIRQEKPNLVRILLVAEGEQTKVKGISGETVLSQRIIYSLREVLGESVNIEVNVVDEIPKPAGSRHKFQPVVSLINNHDKV
jgi:phenylacetate-CoA ligase